MEALLKRVPLYAALQVWGGRLRTQPALSSTAALKTSSLRLAAFKLRGAGRPSMPT